MYISFLNMGEAKRRNELGFPSRKKIINMKKSDSHLSWLSITKKINKRYPYMGVATMILGLFIFLVSGGFNTID